MPALHGETVALAIKSHQAKDARGWAFQEAVQQLHMWVDRLDQDFKLGLPTPVIAIAPMNIGILGCYHLGRNEIGVQVAITLNARWVVRRPWSETLVTLVHELLHAYEELRLGREHGGWYHTKPWREKMAEVGIEADQHGHTLRVLPAFTTYLERYGVQDIRFGLSPKANKALVARPRQMPKWICGCPSGNPARAVKLCARCVLCGRMYRKTQS